MISLLRRYIDAVKLGQKSIRGVLYLLGYTTETMDTPQPSSKNDNASVLYLLDPGFSNKPREVYKKGRILVGRADGKSPLRVAVNGQTCPKPSHFLFRQAKSTGRIYPSRISMMVPSCHAT